MRDDADIPTTRVGNALIALGLAMALGALAVGLATNGGPPAPSGSGTPSPHGTATPSATQAASFVRADGAVLTLDGQPFRYAGTNAYTLMFESHAGVDAHLKIAEDMDLSVVRAWAFYDTGTADGDLAVEGNTRGIAFHSWDASAGQPTFNDGEPGLEHLDYVLASAREHGIKLILPLVNNWTNFGGVDQYVRWAGGAHHDDFFTDPRIRGWYRDWVSHLVNRVNTITGIAYKDDPTIMAWELGNELRCSDSGPYPSSAACGSDMLVAWANEMSTYLTGQDPNHLIGFGGEGFLCTDVTSSDWLVNCTQSADPVALLALPDIDIHGIHVYPTIWAPTAPTSDPVAWGSLWIDQQGQIAADANKPYYLGEYGWTDQATRMRVFDTWLQRFYDAGGDGSHFWVMQPASSIGAPPDGQGFTQKCPGTACQLVSNWSVHVGEDQEWRSFAPIAESDFAFTDGTGAVQVDVLANDKIYPPATLDDAGIDLDPDSAGVQTKRTTPHGTFTVTDGVVSYAADGVLSGSDRIMYTVTDSLGRTSAPATLAVAPSS